MNPADFCTVDGVEYQAVDSPNGHCTGCTADPSSNACGDVNCFELGPCYRSKRGACRNIIWIKREVSDV